MRVLLLSGYDAASHRAWREGLVAALAEHHWRVLSLPARHFAWRLRGNALSWAFGEMAALDAPVDLVLATAMVDLATLRGLVPALVVLGYALVYQQLENYWLSPRISSDTMSLNGGVAFGAALAGGAIGGPIGAFVALPVAALISASISNYARSYDVVYTSAYDDGDDEVAAP